MLAIDRGVGNVAKLFVPAGCVVDHQEAGVQDSVLSSFGDHCSLTVSLETDKPVFGTGVSMSAVEGFRTKTFQMVFREPGVFLGLVGTGKCSVVCEHFCIGIRKQERKRADQIRQDSEKSVADQDCVADQAYSFATM